MILKYSIKRIYKNFSNVRNDSPYGLKIPKYEKGKAYFFNSHKDCYKMIFENGWKLFKKTQDNIFPSKSWKLINKNCDVKNMDNIEGLRINKFNIVQYY